MQVEVHIEWRVPPLAETKRKKRRILELWASAGFEVIHETGVGTHWGVAAPARYRGGCVFGHVLRVVSGTIRNTLCATAGARRASSDKVGRLTIW